MPSRCAGRARGRPDPGKRGRLQSHYTTLARFPKTPSSFARVRFASSAMLVSSAATPDRSPIAIETSAPGRSPLSGDLRFVHGWRSTGHRPSAVACRGLKTQASRGGGHDPARVAPTLAPKPGNLKTRLGAGAFNRREESGGQKRCGRVDQSAGTRDRL
jgi:hypothetical protein